MSSSETKWTTDTNTKSGTVQIYDSSVSTLRITAGESTEAILELFADEGDDNADKWRLWVNDADDDLHFANYTSGSWADLLTIQDGGNVGIANDAPASKLHVTGTVQVGVDGTGHDVVFYSATSGDNLTWDASEEVLQITGTNGQTALDVLDGDLRVVDKIYFYDRGGEYISSNGSVLSIVGGAEIDLTATAIDINGTVDISGELTTNGNIIMANDTSIGIADNAERIEFDSGGDISFLGCNVGIGTTAPRQILEVRADVAGGGAIIMLVNEDESDSTTEYCAIEAQIHGTDVRKAGSLTFNKIGDYQSAGNADSAMKFNTAKNNTNTFAMIIDEDQRVGIGTESPSWHVHVVEDRDDNPAMCIEQDHATGDGLQIRLGKTHPTATEFYLTFQDSSGTNEGSISGDASAGIDVNLTSDRRLKEDIVTIPDAMSIVSAIKPRNFKWKENNREGVVQYGFIADEWFDVFPDKVIGKKDDDGNLILDAMTTNERGEEIMDRQQISTNVVIPVLVKAIQELSAKVTALENA